VISYHHVQESERLRGPFDAPDKLIQVAHPHPLSRCTARDKYQLDDGVEGHPARSEGAQHKPNDGIKKKIVEAIDREIGKIARPHNVWIVPDMPKTRSGKIMRRVIASIPHFTDIGDVTTLANPEIVESIRHQVQAEKVTKGDQPRELSPQELEEIKAFGRVE
jgi:acetyl-CoA synthetase